eukprot:scaffold216259_cov19-Tisochrysis_lutea.AAC.1
MNWGQNELIDPSKNLTKLQSIVQDAPAAPLPSVGAAPACVLCFGIAVDQEERARAFSFHLGAGQTRAYVPSLIGSSC